MPPVDTGFEFSLLLLTGVGGACNCCCSSAAAVYQRHYGKTESVKLIFREAAQMWFAEVAVHYFSSMSSTGRVPSGLQRFLNATAHPFCVAYKVPLEKIYIYIFKEKIIIGLVPFYPALCCSVHLGSVALMIRAVMKHKFKSSVSVFFLSAGHRQTHSRHTPLLIYSPNEDFSSCRGSLRDRFECCPPWKRQPAFILLITQTDYLFMHVRIPWTDEVGMKTENKRKWCDPQPARRLGDWALKVREGSGGMWKMNLGRSAKDWFKRRTKRSEFLPTDLYQKGSDACNEVMSLIIEFIE